MSNMFYDYLSEKIIKYFQTNIPDPGEKYYIQFENDEQVGELYSVLENNIISSSFVYNDIVRGQKYGTYESNGIAFCDKDEVWYLETIGGHHFIARRVEDDEYVVLPNQLNIDYFDLDDAFGKQEKHICSKDLREFIEENKEILQEIINCYNDSSIKEHVIKKNKEQSPDWKFIIGSVIIPLLIAIISFYQSQNDNKIEINN